jgi:hypothetical protein
MDDFVDWDAHLATMPKLTFSEKRFISKFNFQWPPTGHQQRKVDPAQPTPCLSCQNPALDKTEMHLHQCIGTPAQACRILSRRVGLT